MRNEVRDTPYAHHMDDHNTYLSRLEPIQVGLSRRRISSRESSRRAFSQRRTFLAKDGAHGCQGMLFVGWWT